MFTKSKVKIFLRRSHVSSKSVMQSLPLQLIYLTVAFAVYGTIYCLYTNSNGKYTKTMGSYKIENNKSILKNSVMKCQSIFSIGNGRKDMPKDVEEMVEKLAIGKKNSSHFIGAQFYDAIATTIPSMIKKKESSHISFHRVSIFVETNSFTVVDLCHTHLN